MDDATLQGETMGFREDAKTAFRQGQTDTVDRLSQRELLRARAAGDPAGEVEALSMLARVAVRAGDLAESMRLGIEAQAVARRSGVRRLEREPAHIVAGTARMSGDLELARVLYGESIALSEELDEPETVASEYYNLAFVELHTGNLERARKLLATARRQAVALSFDGLLPEVALGTAVLAGADGDASRASRLLAVADAAYRSQQRIPDPDDEIERAHLRDALIAALGPESFEAEYGEGAELDLVQALAD
jgi:hypothetical protein